MKKVRLGIIGLGVQGSFYAQQLTGIQSVPLPNTPAAHPCELIEVAAFCDTNPERRASLKEFHPDIPVYADYIEMLDSGNVDAVVTTVPHFHHTQMGIDALNRGIHVLLEKPAGVYTKQVREIIEVSKAHPELTFGVMFNQRMNPLYKKVREIIQNGEIGEIRRTNWIITNWYRPQGYYDKGGWRGTWGGEGGGVLVNQSPHQLDLLQWLGGIPKSVSANVKFGSHRNIIVENDVTAVLDYGNGATGVFITCTNDFTGTNRFEISGNKGKIIIDGITTATVTRLSVTEEEMNDASLDPNNEDVARLVRGNDISEKYKTVETLEFPQEDPGEFHVAVLRNFADNILNGAPLIAPGEEGINGVRLANAIHLSAFTKSEVSLDFDEELYFEKLNEKIDFEKTLPPKK